MIYPRWIQHLSRADFLRSVGLYVMPGRLFCVRLRKNLFRLSVVEQESRDLPAEDDPALRRQALSEALRSLLGERGVSKDPVYICLSPHQTMVFPLLLPQAAKENLSRVIEYEVERQVPVRREEIYYDFLPAGRKGDKLAFLLFAVPKGALDELLDALSALGINPGGVETTTTAISNYLLFCAEGITGPALVVGAQSQAWEMTGLNTATNGWSQGAEILFSHLVPQSDWVRGPARELFHACLRESPKVFGWGYVQDFLSSVDGESLQVEDLLSLAKGRLRVNQGLDHPFFIPAVGAALRGLREGTFEVSLLPEAGRGKGSKALFWLNVFLSAMLIIELIGWGLSYPVKDEMRLRQLKKENQSLGPSLAALQRQEDDLNKLRKEVAALGAVTERRGEILAILDELSRLVPVNAYLSMLRYQAESVELQGSAENASNLIPILEKSPVFENVRFTAPSNRGRDNRETFSLRADLERKKGKAQP